MNTSGKCTAIFFSVPIVLLLAALILSSRNSVLAAPLGKGLDTIPTLSADKMNANKNKVVGSDTNINIIQTIDTFDIKVAKDTMDAPVAYHADDSMIYDVPAKKIMLYGKTASTKYKDNELTAPGIEYDQESNMITASLQKDSTGNVIAYPNFIQSDFKSVSDTIRFNMKTGKGLTKGTYTQQGEMYIYGEKIKKISPEVFFANKGRFTTCQLDTPHFAFVSNKIKFISQKVAISGPVHPEIEGVPLPVYLPFGIYPLTQGRHSGILAPAFTANEQLGLALEGLGYYKVLSDYWDVTLRGTIYSYGGWMANVSPRYYKRYRYSGNFNLNYQVFKYNFKGDPDYSQTKTINIRWTHSMDSKARPGVTFNANVNAGSSKFNSLVPNSPLTNFSNQLSSTIQYARVWKNKPYNLSLTANHNQNTNQKIINVTLPDVIFNLNTQYPFRRKEVVGTMKWYENIGIALNTNAKSTTFFSDDTAVNRNAIGQQIMNNLQWGANHSVPITLSLPQLGPLQITPSISYVERWYQKKFIRSWNETDEKVDTAIDKGFFTARDISFGLNMSTRIFGMFGFNKNSKVQAIRHEIRPFVSLNYRPDINSKYFYTTQVNKDGAQSRFSVFDGSMYGRFDEGTFGGMSFGLDNNLQMKVKNKKDTTAEMKKVTLIDGLSINGSYNFLADSFQLSNFSMSARTNLFNKINITANANLDPYDTDAKGERIKTLLWKRKPISLGRLTSASLSLSSQFQGGSGSNKKTTKQPNSMGQLYNPNTGMPLDEYQTEAAYINSNPAEFVDFSIPWSVNFSYSLRVNRNRKTDYSGYEMKAYQDVNWSGTLALTPKWQLSMNGFYNITSKELGTMSMSISREMHCWQMSINLSPIGKYRFFNITISPKSGMLRDLRINRTRYFYDL